MKKIKNKLEKNQKYEEDEYQALKNYKNNEDEKSINKKNSNNNNYFNN